MKLVAPPGVLDVARTLERAGYQAWAVGGAVRDALLRLPATDWDLATDARPADVRRVFRRTVPIGLEHGTVGVLAKDGVLYEVTTFRRDVETFGRRAVVEFASTIEEDLARRDFTINALAWRPGTGELRDPFEGRADLDRGRLRTVGEPGQRFAEDWLRVLRAIRFAGQLGLAIEDQTWAALVDAVPHLTDLSAERVREELWKVLTSTRNASVSLDLYRGSSALATLFPELAATVDLDVGAASGASAWIIVLRAVDALPPARLLLRMAALLHLTGCPGARTRDLRGGWRFTGHETIGARKAGEIMRRLKASNAQVERVSTLVRLQRSLFPPDAPDAGVRRWLADVTPALVNDLFRLRIAMWRADPVPGGERDLVERWRHAHRVRLERPPLTVSDLAISGAELKQLGLQPGPRFGALLRALLEEVIERPELNTREALLERVRAESTP